ncbi:MAG: trypsin-like peptidase domain-containing protein [Thermodesulfobacteriota bacterium]
MTPRRFFPIVLAFCLAAGVAAPSRPPAAEQPFARETPVVRAVRQAGPSVVNISTKQVVSGPRGPFRPHGGDEFFDRFFKDFFEGFGPREYTQTSLGSGVIIDSRKKLVLTNEHVVVRASEIKVSLIDDREFNARVVGSDPDSDLAVLQVEADQTLPALTMGDSADLMIGETVIAIGNPFGLTHTVTTGVISAVGRSIRTRNRVYLDFIQTDASINPGNSGGPLLNINGELIGINTAIYGQAEGIGFAIPINKAKRIIKDLLSYGEVHPAWLGLQVQTLDPRLAQYFHLPFTGGAVITEVDPDGPAAGGGLARGDVIMGLGREKVRSVDDYEDLLRGYTAEAEVRLAVHRQGQTKEYTLRAKAFPSKKAISLGWERYGLSVAGEGKGGGAVVIDQVRPGSPADRIGIKPGDLLRRINEIETASVDNYVKAMIKYRLRQGVMAIVQRGRQAYQIALVP